MPSPQGAALIQSQRVETKHPGGEPLILHTHSFTWNGPIHRSAPGPQARDADVVYYFGACQAGLHDQTMTAMTMTEECA